LDCGSRRNSFTCLNESGISLAIFDNLLGHKIGSPIIYFNSEGFGASPGKSPHFPKTRKTIPARSEKTPKRMMRLLKDTSPASAAMKKTVPALALKGSGMGHDFS
jgi:hypothetical protein